MSNLTPKQEGFCRSYIETGNASEAYRLNYDAEKMKPNTVNNKAKLLLKQGPIRDRLTELQQHHQDRHDITVDSITAMYIADREAAREANQYASAITAVTGLAKLHGLITNKQEVTGKDGGPVVEVEMSPNEKARRVLFLLSQGGYE